MLDAAQLRVGLKEWHTVCQAVGEGRQTVLLRKGGIYESAGEFEVEHRQFLLFPTFLHQKLDLLKPSEHAGFDSRASEPAQVTLAVVGQVTDIIELRSRQQMDALDDEHIWTKALIDMRFSYRPENPLYLLVVRAYRLPTPVSVENTIEYAGCKSWVPLQQAVQVSDVLAAVADETFEARRRSIQQRVG